MCIKCTVTFASVVVSTVSDPSMRLIAQTALEERWEYFIMFVRNAVTTLLNLMRTVP